VIGEANRQRVVNRTQSPGEVRRKTIRSAVIARTCQVCLHEHPVKLLLSNDANGSLELVRCSESFSIPLVGVCQCALCSIDGLIFVPPEVKGGAVPEAKILKHAKHLAFWVESHKRNVPCRRIILILGSIQAALRNIVEQPNASGVLGSGGGPKLRASYSLVYLPLDASRR